MARKAARKIATSEFKAPSKELLKAIKEGEELAHDPNAKTYETLQELWDELGIK